MQKVLFVQSFGLADPRGGGSAKIFRNLVEGARCEVRSLVCGIMRPSEYWKEREWYVLERFKLSRIENTRLAHLAGWTRLFSSKRVHDEIDQILCDWSPDHVHIHLHGWCVVPTLHGCLKRNIPYSVSVHDDIRYLSYLDPQPSIVERAAATAWRGAIARFVISPEIGQEYASRYSDEPWIQITDGLSRVADKVRPRVSQRLNLYFCGSVNVPYEPNFLAMQQALKKLSLQTVELRPRFIVRGGRRLSEQDPAAPPIECWPFAPDDRIADDFSQADVLYLPLSFDARDEAFARFSLSTKMITYLGAGLPILLHGPRDSAAYRLLSDAGACIGCFSNDVDELRQALLSIDLARHRLAENALRLGRERFMSDGVRKRFWQAINMAWPSDNCSQDVQCLSMR